MIAAKRITTLTAFAISLLAGSTSVAGDLSQDFDTLGTNRAIVDRARSLHHKNKVQIVQKRSVDRKFRIEFSGQFGMVAGGDAYYDTINQGASVDLHLNHRWSLGVRHYEHSSTLTTEGNRIYDEAERNRAIGLDYDVPELDYPIRTSIGTITWYPLYGKLNLFDLTTIQFDFYFVAGAGQMQLNSGTTSTYTAGSGLAVWLTNHISTRMEVRYQGYSDLSDSRDMHTAIGMISLGVIL